MGNTWDKLQFYSKFKGRTTTLLSSFKTAITTCGVGEIASVEEHFGFLWGHGKDKSKLTENETKFLDIWSQCRDEMLDKMNYQVRSVFKLAERQQGEGQ